MQYSSFLLPEEGTRPSCPVSLPSDGAMAPCTTGRKRISLRAATKQPSILFLLFFFRDHPGQCVTASSWPVLFPFHPERTDCPALCAKEVVALVPVLECSWLPQAALQSYRMSGLCQLETQKKEQVPPKSRDEVTLPCSRKTEERFGT